MKKKYVSITASSDVKADKNGNSYKTVEFATPNNETVKDEDTGEVFNAFIEPKKTSINLYEKSYLNGDMQFGYNLEIGSKLLGDIVTRNVEPYSIPYKDKNGDDQTRMVSTFTTLVLGDTSAADWENKVATAFRNRGHELPSNSVNFSIAKEKSIEEVEAPKAEENKIF